MGNQGNTTPRSVSATLTSARNTAQTEAQPTHDAVAGSAPEVAHALGDARSWLALLAVLLAIFCAAFALALGSIGLFAGSFPSLTDIIGYPSFHNYNNYAPLQAYYFGLGATALASAFAIKFMPRWRDLEILAPLALAAIGAAGVVASALLGVPIPAGLMIAFVAVLATRAAWAVRATDPSPRAHSASLVRPTIFWREFERLSPITLGGVGVLGITIAAALNISLASGLLSALVAMLLLRSALGETLSGQSQGSSEAGAIDDASARLLLVALPWLLFVVSATTGWIEQERFIRLGWFPLPLALAASIGTAIIAYRHGQRVRTPAPSAGGFAHGVLTWGVVPAIVFLLLIDVKSRFTTGHDLFHTGEFIGPLSLAALGDKPWRDFLFVHGIWEDFLKFYPGQLMWEPSLRAAFAFPAIVTGPLYWVTVYLFFVVVTRGSIALSCLALMVTHGVMNGNEYRFALYAVILIALAQWFATRRLGWLCTFSALVTVQCVLAPEFGVVAVGLGCAVAGHGWYTGGPLASRVLPTLIGAGVALLAFLAILAAMWHFDVLDGFVISLAHFARGHLVTGGIPLSVFESLPVVACAILLVIVAGPVLVWRDHSSRRSASVSTLISAGIAIATALYGLKFFGRPDEPHLPHVLAVAAPAIGLLASLFASWLGVALDGLAYRGRPLSPAAVTGAIAAVVFVAGVPGHSAHAPSTAWLNKALVMPGNFRSPAHSELEGNRWAPGIETGGYAARYAEVRAYLSTRVAKNEAIFDFSDSPVLTYGILGLKPASRILHVSMAIRVETQQIVVDDLNRTRPRYVLYRSVGGLNGWDGISSQVRHHLIAAAIHRDYVFETEVGGVTIFIRRDLAAPETLAALVPPALLRCDLGYLPNFLQFGRTNRRAEPVAFVAADGAAQSARGRTLAIVERHPGTHYLQIEVAGERSTEPTVLTLSGRDPGQGAITFRIHSGVERLTLPVGGCLSWSQMKPPLRISTEGAMGGPTIKAIHGLAAGSVVLDR